MLGGTIGCKPPISLSLMVPVAYKVRLHKWVDNDHYDRQPFKEFRVVLSPAGTVMSIVVPAG